jgi:serine/threonine protein kinase
MQFSGTPAYMAPELFQKKVSMIGYIVAKAYDKGVDLFAFGTMLWETFAREVPYEGIDPSDVMTKVVRGEPLQSKGVPRAIMNLVNDLRTIDSSKRPAFDLVLAELKKLNL